MVALFCGTSFAASVSAMIGPKGSFSSREGDVIGEVMDDEPLKGERVLLALILEVIDTLPKLTVFEEEDLLAGEARRESVFRKADLRFGGAGRVEGSSGSLGS